MMKQVIILLILFQMFNLLAGDNYLEDLLVQVLDNNPEIQALKYHISALQEKETVVQKLMDPMFAVEYSSVPIDSWALDETPMSGVQFKLQQTIPFPGKNSAREDIAISETESRSLDLEELKLQLTGKFKKVYYNLYTIRQLKSLSEDHITYLQQLRSSLQAKYETGKSNQHNLLKMDLKIGKLRDDLKDFEIRDLEITSTLNSILNRDISEQIITNKWDEDIIEFDELEILVNKAKLNRPLFKSLEQDIQTKNLEMELVKRDKLPNVTIWAGYRYRQDINNMKNPDFASLGLSFPLPFDFLKKNKAKFSLFKYNKRKIESKYDNVLNKTAAQIKTELVEYKRALEKMKTYKEDLLPGSRTALELTYAAYENGKADFSSLFQAQLQILDFERILVITENETIQHRISLEILTGN
jgi:outer membrane protein, heavy metal efflux system